MVSRYLFSNKQRINGRALTPFVNSGPAGRNTAAISPLSGPPTTNLYLWHDAAYCYTGSDGSGTLITSDDTAVYSMKDMSGNGHHANQSASACQYVYKASIINSLPVIRGNADHVRYMQATSLSLSGAKTFIGVFYFRDWATPRSPFLYRDASAMYYEGPTALTSSPNYNQYSQGVYGSAASISLSAWHLLYYVYNAGSSFVRIDNDSNITSSLPAEITLATFFTGNPTGAYTTDQDIAEYALYSGSIDPTTGDGLLARQYFNTKYALGLGI